MLIEEVNILEKIKRLDTKDDEMLKVVEKIKKTGVKVLWNEEWKEENGLMLKEEKVYVPKNEKLRAEIV